MQDFPAIRLVIPTRAASAFDIERLNSKVDNLIWVERDSKMEKSQDEIP